MTKYYGFFLTGVINARETSRCICDKLLGALKECKDTWISVWERDAGRFLRDINVFSYEIIAIGHQPQTKKWIRCRSPSKVNILGFYGHPAAITHLHFYPQEQPLRTDDATIVTTGKYEAMMHPSGNFSRDSFDLPRLPLLPEPIRQNALLAPIPDDPIHISNNRDAKLPLPQLPVHLRHLHRPSFLDEKVEFRCFVPLSQPTRWRSNIDEKSPLSASPAPTHRCNNNDAKLPLPHLPPLPEPLRRSSDIDEKRPFPLLPQPTRASNIDEKTPSQSYAQSRMANLVKARDGNCLMTGGPITIETHAVHMFSAAESRRSLRAGCFIPQELREWFPGKSINADGCLISQASIPLLPSFTSWYDVRLGITIPARFNLAVERGHIWIERDLSQGGRHVWRVSAEMYALPSGQLHLTDFSRTVFETCGQLDRFPLAFHGNQGPNSDFPPDELIELHAKMAPLLRSSHPTPTIIKNYTERVKKCNKRKSSTPQPEQEERYVRSRFDDIE